MKKSYFILRRRGSKNPDCVWRRSFVVSEVLEAQSRHVALAEAGAAVGDGPRGDGAVDFELDLAGCDALQRARERKRVRVCF